MVTDTVKPVGTALYFLPVETRVPLKFGKETLLHVTCARVRIAVEASDGRLYTGWGETPLSVQWAWPSETAYSDRHNAMKDFTCVLAEAWAEFAESGHPLEIGHSFLVSSLPELLSAFNRGREGREPMPWLAALICCSSFDIALYDAYGKAVGTGVYQILGRHHLKRDLSCFLEPAESSRVSFQGLYPEDFLEPKKEQLAAWHLVGGKDLLTEKELTGEEPDDGYPVTLTDWIVRDGLRCLKVKLRGNDQTWDYERLVQVGEIGIRYGVDWLTSDFNCTVTDPGYVCDILDRLLIEYPRIYAMILYVEQPFPYELEKNRIPVHCLSARKPLFMDESAHDWEQIRLGRKLGWTGVALKTCKTQTGALLSLCWAKAHGMTLMVQDLTNPMLAQIPHVELAAHAGTIMGVETNSMQFYPEASRPEEEVHPGLYRRQEGEVDLSTVAGSGFGYRLEEITRKLPAPRKVCGRLP